MTGSRYIAVVLLFSFLGGLAKVIGGILYGSKALFVDALTCIANFAALIATIYFYRVSRRPPDLDHHYGHYKLGFGGAIVSVLAYSFVAGIVVSRLSTLQPYRVEIGAPVFALLGFVFYLIAIVTAKRISGFFTPYSMFTVSELIESLVVIAASLAGALYSYLVDYFGAAVLAAYIFVELYGTTKDLIVELSDIAPPPRYVEDIKRFLESIGLRVESIKVRRIHPRLYHGDIVVSVEPGCSLEELREELRRVKRELYKRFMLDASIEIT